MRNSFEAVADALGDKIGKKAEIFVAQPTVECAVCADVPNLMEIVPEMEFLDEIECCDLFEGSNRWERMMVWKLM